VVAATPSPAVAVTIKQERLEPASGSEAMDEGEAAYHQEHPSAAAAIGSAQTARTVVKMEISPSDTPCEIPLVTENGDLPMDLVKAMFRDLDASQRKGDGDVN
jgi:hypothetical protein